MNPNWQVSWVVLRTAVEEWESFLFSPEVEWPLHFEPGLKIKTQEKIKLSAGRICLALNLLRVFKITNHLEKTEDVEQLLQETDRLINQWQASWEKKILKEIPIRTRLYEKRVQELSKEDNRQTGLFSLTVELRLMLAAMGSFLPEITKQNLYLQLNSTDRKFMNISEPSEFIWQNELAQFYDTEKEWFLFRSLK